MDDSPNMHIKYQNDVSNWRRVELQTHAHTQTNSPHMVEPGGNNNTRRNTHKYGKYKHMRINTASNIS